MPNSNSHYSFKVFLLLASSYLLKAMKKKKKKKNRNNNIFTRPNHFKMLKNDRKFEMDILLEVAR